MIINNLFKKVKVTVNYIFMFSGTDHKGPPTKFLLMKNNLNRILQFHLVSFNEIVIHWTNIPLSDCIIDIVSIQYYDVRTKSMFEKDKIG